MLDYFSSLLFGKKSNLPNVDEAPTPSPSPKPHLTAVPAPLKPQPAPELLTRNWSHPFGDRSHPLQQLTHLANASAGYYPVGVNGTWHGGVHFDHGTAGALDQSRVLCLADGEVVAWRIPTNTPTTRYFPAAGVTLDAPCASGFVLVRHRIQAPAIEGCDQVPPDLTFYSLYMHLEDWTAYQDGRQDRPAFWPQSKIMWVRDDASDVRPGSPTELGARTIHSDWQPQTLDFLPRGTQVTVGSAQGRYLTLEDAVAPLSMLAADGSLPGYIAFKSLVDNGKGLYRVAGDGRIRAAGHVDSKVLGRLHQHTLVRISGEGDFRKLERVVPLVEAAALRGERKPTVFDRVFVPETPIPVMAGELIGHVGPYQESNETTAQRKLHLEVFCEEDFSVFLKASRAWAERLPAEEKTWLKLVKGTRVVPHQAGYGGKWQPAWEGPHQLSGADLLVPKSLLDNLPPEKRISAAATQFGKPRNWYYLEGLLNDADGTMVDGWVLEVVGETPWVSPWHWDGYDVIRDSSTPTQGHAYRLSLRKDLSEEHLARLRPHADQWDEGPLQSRLYDLIDRNRDGIMSAAEIRMAMKVPAHAQSLSKIVLHCESEWEYSEEKWDALDDIFGHTTSAPILNWVAEKERIKLLSWWEEAGRELGFWLRRPVYFLQPIGLAGNFIIDENDLCWLRVPFGQLTFDVEGNDMESSKYFSRVVHWPGGASGITIGRGYDLGQRPYPELDLRNAEVQEPLLSWLIGAKGRKGINARDYLASAPKSIVKLKISRRQQYKLFLPVYETMRRDLLRVSNKAVVVEAYGAVTWESTDKRIQEVMIDLIYRGDYTGRARRFLQKPFAENDFLEFKVQLNDRSNWGSVPSDRFNKRRSYLQ